MSHQALGAFIFFSVIGVALLIFTVFKPTAGMSIIAAIFGLSGIAIFGNATAVMQEIEGILFLVGSAVCAGFAGIARQLKIMMAKSNSAASSL